MARGMSYFTVMTAVQGMDTGFAPQLDLPFLRRMQDGHILQEGVDSLRVATYVVNLMWQRRYRGMYQRCMRCARTSKKLEIPSCG